MWGNALISNSIYVLMIICVCERGREEGNGRQGKKEEQHTKMRITGRLWAVRSFS